MWVVLVGSSGAPMSIHMYLYHHVSRSITEEDGPRLQSASSHLVLLLRARIGQIAQSEAQHSLPSQFVGLPCSAMPLLRRGCSCNRDLSKVRQSPDSSTPPRPYPFKPHTDCAVCGARQFTERAGLENLIICHRCELDGCTMQVQYIVSSHLPMQDDRMVFWGLGNAEQSDILTLSKLPPSSIELLRKQTGCLPKVRCQVPFSLLEQRVVRCQR
jgi:hypothetical protein